MLKATQGHRQALYMQALYMWLTQHPSRPPSTPLTQQLNSSYWHLDRLRQIQAYMHIHTRNTRTRVLCRRTRAPPCHHHCDHDCKQLWLRMVHCDAGLVIHPAHMQPANSREKLSRARDSCCIKKHHVFFFKTNHVCFFSPTCFSTHILSCCWQTVRGKPYEANCGST